MLVFLREVSFETMRLIGTVNVCVNIYIYVSGCSGKYDVLLRKIGWEKISGYFFRGDILFCCLEVVFMFSG